MKKTKRVYCSLDDLGFSIFEERSKRGWSQRYTAKALGISYQSYQNWENGLTKSVTPQNFEKIKDVFSAEYEAV